MPKWCHFQQNIHCTTSPQPFLANLKDHCLERQASRAATNLGAQLTVCKPHNLMLLSSSLTWSNRTSSFNKAALCFGTAPGVLLFHLHWGCFGLAPLQPPFKSITAGNKFLLTPHSSLLKVWIHCFLNNYIERKMKLVLRLRGDSGGGALACSWDAPKRRGCILQPGVIPFLRTGTTVSTPCTHMWAWLGSPLLLPSLKSSFASELVCLQRTWETLPLPSLCQVRGLFESL